MEGENVSRAYWTGGKRGEVSRLGNQKRLWIRLGGERRGEGTPKPGERRGTI